VYYYRYIVDGCIAQSWMRVESGPDFCKFRRVGSRNLNIFIHVFHKLQNFARIEKLLCEFDLFSKWVGSRFCKFRRVGLGRVKAPNASGRQKVTRVQLRHSNILSGYAAYVDCFAVRYH
jgi:hypothetical protein